MAQPRCRRQRPGRQRPVSPPRPASCGPRGGRWSPGQPLCGCGAQHGSQTAAKRSRLESFQRLSKAFEGFGKAFEGRLWLGLRLLATPSAFPHGLRHSRTRGGLPTALRLKSSLTRRNSRVFETFSSFFLHFESISIEFGRIPASHQLRRIFCRDAVALAFTCEAFSWDPTHVSTISSDRVATVSMSPMRSRLLRLVFLGTSCPRAGPVVCFIWTKLLHSSHDARCS